MPPRFAPPDRSARPLHVITPDALDAWRANLSDNLRAWVEESGFTAASGQLCLLPAPDGSLAGAAFGLGGAPERARQRFAIAAAADRLPAGSWRIVAESGLDTDGWSEAALGWLLAGYQFTRYGSRERDIPRLVAPKDVDSARLEAIAAGEWLTRDLINTPANDMGPAEIEGAARALAKDHGARIEVAEGDALERGNLPLIHAVGRASPRHPRLIDLRHGSAGPRLTLVGKGVAFDTGGLNLKPGTSMALMKKDMGGAATVLGLASTILSLDLPLQLRVLIPAVENAVGGGAFRPGDILTARNGLTVEVNNTDAEGRLVLADALALADEDEPDLIVSMATLTGAARVAVGPDIAPFYTRDARIADAVARAGAQVRDPVWRMPLHAPYESMIEPGIADLDNAPSGGFAGSITAALFLHRFVTRARYLHFDVFGWQPVAAPARPKGGVGQGARAVLDALPELLDLPRP